MFFGSVSLAFESPNSRRPGAHQVNSPTVVHLHMSTFSESNASLQALNANKIYAQISVLRVAMLRWQYWCLHCEVVNAIDYYSMYIDAMIISQ